MEKVLAKVRVGNTAIDNYANAIVKRDIAREEAMGEFGISTEEDLEAYLIKVKVTAQAQMVAHEMARMYSGSGKRVDLW